MENHALESPHELVMEIGEVSTKIANKNILKKAS